MIDHGNMVGSQKDGLNSQKAKGESAWELDMRAGHAVRAQGTSRSFRAQYVTTITSVNCSFIASVMPVANIRLKRVHQKIIT